MSLPGTFVGRWRLFSVTAMLLLLSLLVIMTSGSTSARLHAPFDMPGSGTQASLADCTAQWEEVPSPNKGQHNTYLALGFTGPYEGWAVGSYDPVTNGPTRTLISRWDGFHVAGRAWPGPQQYLEPVGWFVSDIQHRRVGSRHNRPQLCQLQERTGRSLGWTLVDPAKHTEQRIGP